ncbi:MAG: ATP-binding protein [Myxococcota bacterium]
MADSDDASDTEPTLDSEIQDMLRNVTRHLGLEFGIVSRVEGGRYRVDHVFAADGSIPQGAEFDLGDTYCSLTLAADDVVDFGEANGSSYGSHPCYQAFGLESYIGMPIRIRERTDGTLNFSSRRPRSGGYTETERDLVRLFARWVGRTMERQEVTRELITAARSADLLRASLEAIVQAAPDGIVVHRSGKVLWLNATLAEMMRGRPEDFLGRSLMEFIPENEDRDLAIERLAVLAKGDRPEAPQSLTVTRLDGTEAHIDTIGVPAIWNGEPAAYTFVRDKTQERLTQAQLLQSERLASIGTLAAGVAHELNNPLAYVLANLDVVVEELAAIGGASPPARIRELISALKEAREGAVRARKIVRNLRTFSRIDDEVRVAHDVHRLLEVAISMSMNEIRHHAELERHFEEVPLVEVDESRLTQVFVNLLVNASQAIPDDAKTRRITVSTFTDRRGWAVIEVQDTGTGISEDLLPRIFDPFTTTKPAGIGTGLGLSVSLQIINKLGGQLSAENHPDGAILRVGLPPASSEAVANEIGETGRPAKGPQGRRILVIDDDRMVGKALARALGRDNDVVICEGGREALELLAADANFDVLLCDLMMPEVAGWDFHAAIEKDFPELTERILFVTGGSVGSTARKFLQSLSSPVIEKPFNLRTLRALVKQVAK